MRQTLLNRKLWRLYLVIGCLGAFLREAQESGLAAGSGVVSGEAIQVTGGPGPLSLESLWNRQLGVARVTGGEGPDLFVASRVVTAGGVRLPQEERHDQIFLYPWKGDADGVPVFGNAELCGNEVGKELVPKRVFPGDDDEVYLALLGAKDLVIARFDKADRTFRRLRVLEGFQEGNRLGTNSEICFLKNPDGSYEVVYTVSEREGDYFGEQAAVQGYHQRGPFLDTLDGSRIWRGDLGKSHLRAVTTKELGVTPFTGDRAISSPVTSTFGKSVTAASFGPGRERDVLAGGQYGNTHYFHNPGDQGIDLSPMRQIADQDGVILRHPTIDASPVSYPNRDTGLNSDLLSTGEGWIYCYRFTGKFTVDGAPMFEDPVPVLQQHPTLNFEALAVVNLVDWDGDGLLDIVSGNAPGFVLFSKNAGTREQPAFAPPTCVLAGGRPIHRQPGYWGSVQGPLEARWGYSAPRVTDWNGDGLPDILISGSPQSHEAFINRGAAGRPGLDLPRPLYLDGLNLHGTWRVQPGTAIIGGRQVYVSLDDDDEFHRYWRIDDFNLADDGKLRLADGAPIRANYRSAGGTGRAKITLADWDRDGDQDLLVGTYVDHSIPTLKLGLPSSNGTGASILLLRNGGTDAKPAFDWPSVLHFRGNPVYFGVHSCSVATGDLNGDGVDDLLVGDETGRATFFDGRDVEFRAADLDSLPVNCVWQNGLREAFWHRDINWWRGVPRPRDRAQFMEDANVNLERRDAACLDLAISRHSNTTLTEISNLEIEQSLVISPNPGNRASLTLGGGRTRIQGDLIICHRGESGHLVLDDAELSAGRLKITTGAGPGKVTLRSGRLLLDGDQTRPLAGLVAAGLIAPADSKQGLDIRFDPVSQQTLTRIRQEPPAPQ